jgi:hypothetical protein
MDTQRVYFAGKNKGFYIVIFLLKQNTPLLIEISIKVQTPCKTYADGQKLLYLFTFKNN